jgi:hypothetical protein
VTMFTDGARQRRLRLAFEARRVAIWLGPILSAFVRRMVRQSLFEACRERTGRRFGDDVYGRSATAAIGGLRFKPGARRFGRGRFLPPLSDGWPASPSLIQGSRPQGGDSVMTFKGAAWKRKIRLALFANPSPCDGVSDSYSVCFIPDPFLTADGVVIARQSRGGGI